MRVATVALVAAVPPRRGPGMTDTTTLTLTEFLERMIAEDEAAARAVAAPGRPLEAGRYFRWMDNGRTVGNLAGNVVAYGVDLDANRAHIARHDPARVLAECEAKRTLLDHVSSNWRLEEYVARLLATVYSDHPDYRESWRP